MQEIFDVTDYHLGLCTKDKIGQPKVLPDSPTVQEPLAQSAEDAVLTLKELRQKAVQLALKTPRFFEEDPAFHKRFLLAVAKFEEPSGSPSSLTVNISWLNPDRLSYKHGGSASDTVDVVPRALPSVPKADLAPPTVQGWKEPEPEVTGINSLLHDALNPASHSGNGAKS